MSSRHQTSCFQGILNCLDFCFFFWNWSRFCKKARKSLRFALIIEHRSKQNIEQNVRTSLWSNIKWNVLVTGWTYVTKGRISRIKTQPRQHKSRGFMKLSYREIWTYFYQECLSFRKFMEIDLTRSTKLKASQPCQFQA